MSERPYPDFDAWALSFTQAHVRELSEAATSTIKFRAALAAELRRVYQEGFDDGHMDGLAAGT